MPDKSNLEHEIHQVNKLLSKRVSYRHIFMLGIIQGIGSAIGATIIAGIVFAFLFRFINQFGNFDFLEPPIVAPPYNQQTGQYE